MKKTNLLLSLFASLLMLGACSEKDNSDLMHLLTTVPSDASAVAVVDVPEIIEEAGGTVSDDGAMKLSPELADALAGNRDLAAFGKALAKGETGLMAAPIVWFAEGDVQYFTGLLSDPAAFRQFAAEQQGEEFTDEQGVSLCGYFAVKGNQFWYSRSSLGAKEINRFSELDAKRSYAKGAGIEILTSEADVRGVFDINAIVRQAVAPGSRAMTNVAIATLFKDAEYASLKIDFKKGDMLARVKVYNSKMEPSKFLLPADKISAKSILNCGETADAVMGINVSKKLISTIMEKAEAFIPREFGEILKPVDGTVAYACGIEDSEDQTLVITTDGANATPLATMLQQHDLGNVTVKGRQVVAEKGKTQGPILMKDAAYVLSDAFAGVIAAPAYLYPGSTVEPSELAKAGKETADIKYVSVLLKPYEGSLKLIVDMRLVNKKECSLIPLLRLTK